MSEQNKKKNGWRPVLQIGFLFFLLAGAAGFLFLALKIQIPVYTTVQTRIETENGGIRVNLHDTAFQADAPVFLYQSRDDHLEKITAYHVENGYLYTAFSDALPDSGTIYLDVQIREVSLLRHILTEGGNT